MKEKLYKWIFICLCIALCIPMLAPFLPKYEVAPLKGDIASIVKPKFTWGAFFDGSYANQMDEYTKMNFGYYPSFIRIDNQLEYWISNNAKANGVVIGKNDCLYEKKYIDAYYGNDYLGNDSIQHLITKLSLVRDTLQKQGKDIWIMLLPGKASIIPENIPDKYISTKAKNTNYLAFKNTLKEFNIPTLDLQEIYLKTKPYSVYPLFPKLGIHWSEMAELHSMNLMARFAENQLDTILPKLIIKNGGASFQTFGRDRDIADAMNLFFPLKAELLYYPAYSYTEDMPGPKKVLVIGDSFYFGPHGKHFSDNTFGMGSFWYYNQVEYLPNEQGNFTLENSNRQEKWEQHDIVCIQMTEVNLVKFGYGFIEQAYQAYYPNSVNKELQKKGAE